MLHITRLRGKLSTVIYNRIGFDMTHAEEKQREHTERIASLMMSTARLKTHLDSHPSNPELNSAIMLLRNATRRLRHSRDA